MAESVSHAMAHKEGHERQPPVRQEQQRPAGQQGGCRAVPSGLSRSTRVGSKPRGELRDAGLRGLSQSQAISDLAE